MTEPVDARLPEGLPSSYIIMHNVSKKHNVGTIARCATAFNVRQIVLVGSNRFNVFGSHGADSHVDFAWQPSVEEACRVLREDCGAQIVGVEIDPSALPLQSFPFKGPTAFMLGNEGQGLSPRQMRNCDAFVYIPQFGPGTASLNVAVAASIVLHRFALWAGYPERERQGQKYVVAERPVQTRGRGIIKAPGTREDLPHDDHAVDLAIDFNDDPSQTTTYVQQQLASA